MRVREWGRTGGAAGVREAARGRRDLSFGAAGVGKGVAGWRAEGDFRPGCAGRGGCESAEVGMVRSLSELGRGGRAVRACVPHRGARHRAFLGLRGGGTPAAAGPAQDTGTRMHTPSRASAGACPSSLTHRAAPIPFPGSRENLHTSEAGGRSEEQEGREPWGETQGERGEAGQVPRGPARAFSTLHGHPRPAASDASMTSRPTHAAFLSSPGLTGPTLRPPHTTQPPWRGNGAVSSGATGRKTILGPE